MAKKETKTTQSVKRWFALHWPAVIVAIVLLATAGVTLWLWRSMVAGDIEARVGIVVDLWMLAISISVLLTIYYQLKLHRRERATDWARELSGIDADHDRRKKQATIEIVERLTPRWLDLRVEIEQKLGSGHLTPLSADQNARIRTDDELRGWVAELLNMLELLATGANTRVYDDKLLFRMSASFLLSMYAQFEIYITETRRSHPTNFIEFVALTKRFKKWQIQPPDPDTVVISVGGAR